MLLVIIKTCSNIICEYEDLKKYNMEIIVNTIVEILWFLVSDPHKGESLSMCDELL